MAELHGMRLRGIEVELSLAPSVTVDGPAKLAFQNKLEQEAMIELTSVEKDENSVVLTAGSKSTKSSCGVRMEPNRLSIAENFPPVVTEQCVERMDAVVRAAIEVFSPNLFVQRSVYVRKQASAPNGDARVFLGERVLQLSEARKRSFGRPIHMVGMTFFLPPYQVQNSHKGVVVQQAPDGIEVKIESLIEDTKDIYFQCRRYFYEPVPASKFTTVKEWVVSTEGFVNEQLVNFLLHQTD